MPERWRHRLRVAEALIELWWARLRLGRLSSEDLVRIFSQPALDEVDEALRASHVAAVGAAVFRAGCRCGFSATCLQRAWAARRMLRRRGLACVVHHAVARDDDGSLSGHVWVSSKGLPVTGLRARSPCTAMQTSYGLGDL